MQYRVIWQWNSKKRIKHAGYFFFFTFNSIKLYNINTLGVEKVTQYQKYVQNYCNACQIINIGTK